MIFPDKLKRLAMQIARVPFRDERDTDEFCMPIKLDERQEKTPDVTSFRTLLAILLSHIFVDIEKGGVVLYSLDFEIRLLKSLIIKNLLVGIVSLSNYLEVNL